MITIPFGFVVRLSFTAAFPSSIYSAYPDSAKGKMNARDNLMLQGPNSGIGMGFTSRKWSEEKLVGYAYAFEQATQVSRCIIHLCATLTVCSVPQDCATNHKAIQAAGGRYVIAPSL